MDLNHADAKSAHQYLIDPLLAPDPSDETGPGTHFRSTFAPAESPPGYPSPPNSASAKDPPVQARQSTGSSTNPFRKSSAASKDGSRRVSGGYATPPSPASPRRADFSHREEAFPAFDRSSPRSRRSGSESRSPGVRSGGRQRRSSSLLERYPGDKSVHPLDQLKREEKLARRSPHLRKKHIPGADTIDRLDSINGRYHHEGPYDAALLARNTSWETSPLAAVADSNAEAIKATPAENIRDALERHRPIDNVAVVPPGYADQLGRVYDYEEGEDMMIANGGDFRRWPGIDYHPNDIKGKGEPSYSLDEAMKRHRISKGSPSDIEMTTRPRNKSDATPRYKGPYLNPNDARTVGEQRDREWNQGRYRSNSTGRSMTEGLKRRLGSMRRRKDRID